MPSAVATCDCHLVASNPRAIALSASRRGMPSAVATCDRDLVASNPRAVALSASRRGMPSAVATCDRDLVASNPGTVVVSAGGGDVLFRARLTAAPFFTLFGRVLTAGGRSSVRHRAPRPHRMELIGDGVLAWAKPVVTPSAATLRPLLPGPARVGPRAAEKKGRARLARMPASYTRAGGMDAAAELAGRQLLRPLAHGGGVAIAMTGGLRAAAAIAGTPA
jgi:hypothetical protein